MVDDSWPPQPAGPGREAAPKKTSSQKMINLLTYQGTFEKPEPDRTRQQHQQLRPIEKPSPRPVHTVQILRIKHLLQVNLHQFLHQFYNRERSPVGTTIDIRNLSLFELEKPTLAAGANFDEKDQKAR